MMCDVESVEDTEIICLIADSGEVHAVTNLGTHRGKPGAGCSILRMLLVKVSLKFKT